MCRDCENDPRGICFYHKLHTLTFGSVPGGARQRSGFDKEALEHQFGNLERNEHDMMEATEGLGALKWDKGEAFHKDRKTGDYVKLTASDYDRLMYGSSRAAEKASSDSTG